MSSGALVLNNVQQPNNNSNANAQATQQNNSNANAQTTQQNNVNPQPQQNNSNTQPQPNSNLNAQQNNNPNVQQNNPNSITNTQTAQQNNVNPQPQQNNSNAQPTQQNEDYKIICLLIAKVLDELSIWFLKKTFNNSRDINFDNDVHFPLFNPIQQKIFLLDQALYPIFYRLDTTPITNEADWNQFKKTIETCHTQLFGMIQTILESYTPIIASLEHDLVTSPQELYNLKKGLRSVSAAAGFNAGIPLIQATFQVGAQIDIEGSLGYRNLMSVLPRRIKLLYHLKTELNGLCMNICESFNKNVVMATQNLMNVEYNQMPTGIKTYRDSIKTFKEETKANFFPLAQID